MNCSDYEGFYVMTSQIPPDKQLRVECTTEGVRFHVNEDPPYAAEINGVGQLEVEALGLIASVTGTEPNRYLFGVASFTGESGLKLTEGGVSQPEPWGAEEGMVS